MSINNYSYPFIECQNLIIDKDGIYGITDLDLLLKCIENTQLFNLKKSTKYTLWFNEGYTNILPFKQHIKQLDKNKLHMNMQFLLQDIIKQIRYLESVGKTIVSINMNDIIVINGVTFLFINEYKICNICAERNFALTYMPIPTNDYIAPEILNTKLVLPLKFNSKCCYWSLGALVLDVLFNYKIDIDYEINYILKLIKPVSFTPLYYFILRCIEKDINNRTLIII